MSDLQTDEKVLADSVDETSEKVSARAEQKSNGRRSSRRKRLRTVLVVLLPIAIVLFAGAAVWLRFQMIEGQHDIDASAAVAQAAKDGAVSILSYKPDTVDSDLAKAKPLLTGDFLDYYNNFTATVVAPASKEKKVATTATVPAVSVVSVDGSHAVVLAFVNQTTTTGDAPQSTDSASSVRIELTKVDGHWLIDKFDPA